jgi:hypothetical protein
LVPDGYGRIGGRMVIVCAGPDGTVQIWDVSSGQALGDQEAAELIHQPFSARPQSKRLQAHLREPAE